MDYGVFLPYLIVMAVTTYLTRMLPLLLCKKKIKNPFVRSFLAYVPYAVLSAMTIPGILYSTGHMLTAAIGLFVALLLAFFERSLLTVAMCASGAVFLAQFLIG